MRGPILIVDDDPATRELVACTLGSAGYDTLELPTGEQALIAAGEERPALVVLDVKLPGVSGYEVCRQLRERFGEQLPILFVSGERAEAHDRVAGLMIGADDYVTKPFLPDELLARVGRLLVRAKPPAVAADDDLERWAQLTDREREVLNLLAEGLSQDAIAERLYISPKTVATHIQRILAKLGVHSRAAAVSRAYRLGLVSPDFATHMFAFSDA
ncbi:MAG: two-component system response regulator CreB [Candidatus Rokuibacteriota bacterium]|nr:MAG: two-component system response regulator CreB [Candidatus Rokubacteria bacterium]